MDILIIGARRYPPLIGGLERYIYEFTQVATELGHDITILTQMHKGEKKFEEKENLKIIRGYAPEKQPIDRLFLLLNTMLKREKGYDVCWGHGTIGAMAKWGEPYAYTIHGFTSLRETDKNPIFNKFQNFFEFKILDKADLNIGVDKKSTSMAKRFNENSYLVENGVDIKRFEKDYENPYPSKGKHVLFVGRLIESKGTLDIINGFKKYADDNVYLHIVGDGELKERVKKEANESDSIIYEGRVDIVEKYFQHADLYVLPSYYEGFPTTVLEGMAAKTPTVVSNLPAFKGNFEDGRETLIFEAGDVEGMMKDIENVLNDKKLREKLVKNAYNKIINEYTWEAQTKKILGLFEKLIDDGRNER